MIKKILFFLILLLSALLLISCEEEVPVVEDCGAICLSDATHKEGWYDNCTGKRILWDYCLHKDTTVLRTPMNCPASIIGYDKCSSGWAQIQRQNGCKQTYCLGDFNLGPHDIVIKNKINVNQTK